MIKAILDNRFMMMPAVNEQPEKLSLATDGYEHATGMPPVVPARRIRSGVLRPPADCGEWWKVGAAGVFGTAAIAASVQGWMYSDELQDPLFDDTRIILKVLFGTLAVAGVLITGLAIISGKNLIQCRQDEMESVVLPQGQPTRDESTGAGGDYFVSEQGLWALAPWGLARLAGAAGGWVAEGLREAALPAAATTGALLGGALTIPAERIEPLLRGVTPGNPWSIY